jgi:sarcosine oxidase
VSLATPLPQPRSPLVDVVVVGAGVMGAAAAWRLARGGATVVVLDRFPAGHTHGASHGASRMFHHADPSPRYLRLAAEALPLWRDLEAETGAQLLTITGGVDHGDPVTTSAIADVLAAHGVRHEWLDPSDAGLRWPGMRFDGPVLHQPDGAGRIDGDQAVAALTAAARGHGAQVRRPLAATAVDVRHDDLVHVHTPEGVIAARRAVITVGAWTVRLIDGAVDLPPLRVAQEQPAHFPFHDVPPCVARPGAWPTFVHHGPGAYGLADPCGDVKVGLQGTGVECDPDRPIVSPEQGGLARLQDYVATWLPGLDPSRPRPVSRTHTSTADGEFVLRRHGPLVVGAGFADHGLTHAPVVGETLAELAAPPRGGWVTPGLRARPAVAR